MGHFKDFLSYFLFGVSSKNRLSNAQRWGHSIHPGNAIKKKIPPSETAQDNGYLTTFTQYYAKHMKV